MKTVNAAVSRRIAIHPPAHPAHLLTPTVTTAVRKVALMPTKDNLGLGSSIDAMSIQRIELSSYPLTLPHPLPV